MSISEFLAPLVSSIIFGSSSSLLSSSIATLLKPFGLAVSYLAALVLAFGGASSVMVVVSSISVTSVLSFLAY